MRPRGCWVGWFGWVSIAGAMLLSIGLAPWASAGPGDLDTSFGEYGQVLTDFGVRAKGTAIAIQSDGRIVVAGRTRGSRFTTEQADFAVARYLPDGKLDPTFGADGLVTTDISGQIDSASQVLLQPDGKIIVAGTGDRTAASEPISDFAVIRYTADGRLDQGFGTDGKVTTDFGFTEAVLALALQSDGKIVAGGYSFDDPGDGPSFSALARYNSDGSLDASFGTDGTVLTPGGEVMALSIQPDDRILVVGGGCCSKVGEYVFRLARYYPDGSLDTSFGDQGFVTTHTIRFQGPFSDAVVFGADGSIFAAGFQHYSNERCSCNAFAVVKLSPLGNLDSSFGHDGEVQTIIGSSSYANAVAVLADGKVVAAGFAFPYGGGLGKFAVVRYNADGSRDQTFGRHGKVVTQFGRRPAKAAAVGIDADGRAIVAGIAGRQFASARYLG